MSSSNLSLEQIKATYDNNYYLLQSLDSGANNCLKNPGSPNCEFDQMYGTLKNQNQYLNNLINSQIKTTNTIKNRKFNYQNDQTVYLMYINFILFILYYVIAIIFLLLLIYRVFFSTSSKIDFSYVKKFLYNYLLIILLIFFYPFYIRPITLIVINILKYIYSVINSDVYISQKY